MSNVVTEKPNQSSGSKRGFDPFRILEFPAAIFVINITLFTIIWKTVGVSWIPFGLGERFQEVFSAGYYPRDMQRNESAYNILFLLMYGVLGTAAQIASVRIAMLRRKPESDPGLWRWVFAIFHIAIATYHVLFVFQFVKGKMILDGMASWQMLATQALYVLELIMAIELIFVAKQTFFRRKVCLDIVSCCNLIPFLIFWAFAIGSIDEPTLTKLVGYSFFTVIPLALFIVEWATWAEPRCRSFTERRPLELQQNE